MARTRKNTERASEENVGQIRSGSALGKKADKTYISTKQKNSYVWKEVGEPKPNQTRKTVSLEDEDCKQLEAASTVLLDKYKNLLDDYNKLSAEKTVSTEYIRYLAEHGERTAKLETKMAEVIAALQNKIKDLQNENEDLKSTIRTMRERA